MQECHYKMTIPCFSAIFAVVPLRYNGLAILLLAFAVFSCSGRPTEDELAKRVIAFLKKMPSDEVVYMKMIGSKEPDEVIPQEAAALVVAIDELKTMSEQLVKANPESKFQPYTLPSVNKYTMPGVIRGYQAETYMRFLNKYRYRRTDLDYIEYKNHADELGKDQKFRSSVREKVLTEEQLDEYETLYEHLRDIDNERAYLRSLKK